MDHRNPPDPNRDPFAPDLPACPYAADGKCPLVIEDPRGAQVASLITLGTCADCPGHNQTDLFGGPHAGGPPRR